MKKTFVIAEIGSMHDGSFGNATKAVELAQHIGADAVKFQTHLAQYETVKNAPNPSYFKGEPRYDYFKRTAFSTTQWKELKAFCDELAITFISSPFSKEAVDLLEDVGVQKYKIPSGEVTNIELLEAAANTGKPIILSSGMSNWEELDNAVQVLQRGDVQELTVLQCSSAYPCPIERVGLNIIKEIKHRYGCIAGFSDHTSTNYAAFAAVSLGAEVIEKHLTFSKHMYGSDAPLAAEPDQFREMIEGIRTIEKILAHPVDKDDLTPYSDMKKVFEKSIVANENIEKNSIITASMLGVKKPGTGLPPNKLSSIIGKRAKRKIKKDTLLSLSDYK